ncbi:MULTISPECIES: PAAR domain-containing protein [Pseudomonadaceae]|uniref:PAAR domain-containing protein n=1 Tax=Pseudomonadaceae TaxID=135621 RepID=UPI0015C7580E
MSGKPAARQSDPTSCPIQGHGTIPVTTGSPNVLFDGLPAARMGDTTACGGSIAGAVSSTVFINGMSAATVGSTSNHGGVIVAGSGSILIGDTVVPATFDSPTALGSLTSMMKVVSAVIPVSLMSE